MAEWATWTFLVQRCGKAPLTRCKLEIPRCRNTSLSFSLSAPCYCSPDHFTWQKRVLSPSNCCIVFGQIYSRSESTRGWWALYFPRETTTTIGVRPSSCSQESPTWQRARQFRSPLQHKTIKQQKQKKFCSSHTIKPQSVFSSFGEITLQDSPICIFYVIVPSMQIFTQLSICEWECDDWLSLFGDC